MSTYVKYNHDWGDVSRKPTFNGGEVSPSADVQAATPDDINDEKTARQASDEVLDNRIDSITDDFESKDDAKAKANAYGLMMRNSGYNTLQFYRPAITQGDD